MAFVPSPDTVQAELVFSYDGQVVQNVLHYTPSVALTDDLMTELADELITWFDTSLDVVVSDQLTLELVRVTDLTTQFSNGFDITGGLPLSGTLTGSSHTPLPSNVALSITKQTFFRGRSRRGRVFHCGLTDGQVTFNNVTASALTAILGAWTALIDLSTTGADWELQVLSRVENGVDRAQALLTPVEFMSSDGVIDSQRRRLPGRGQ